MKVLLISPYSDISSMGLRSISACLKRAGHNTRMIFLPYPYPETARTVDFQHRYTAKILDGVASLAQDVDLIGISLMTNYFTMAEDLTVHLHATAKAPIIWGGIHPSVRPDECLELADMICICEGEQAVVELANRITMGENLEDVQNIWLKRDGVIIKNPLRPVLSDLDILPYFDYDFDDHYVLEKESGDLLKLDKDLLHVFLTREKPTKARAALFYQTIASRGCPYGCTFCCWSALKRQYKLPKDIRRRSNQHIIGELQWVRRELPYIKEITFSDDSFFAATVEEAEEFRDLYKKHVGLPFQCLAEPRTITKEKMELFTDAGMANIQIGVQTGSDRVKKMYGRPQTNDEIISMGRLIKQFIPKVRPPIYDFILDNPWETIDDQLATFELLLQIPRPYFLQLFSLVFFPGTAIYDRAKQEGRIKDDRKEIYDLQYNTRKITYVNLLFSLFSRSIPTSVMRLLTKPSIVKTLNRPSVNALLALAYKVFSRVRTMPLSARQLPIKPS